MGPHFCTLCQKLIEKYSLDGVTVFDSSWGSLNESGERIGIKNTAGEFIEQFSYVSSTDFSLEKIDVLVNDYSAQNWKEHPSGNTIGTENFWSLDPPEVLEEDDQDIEEKEVLPDEQEEPKEEFISVNSSTILISEVVSNPEEGKEWIELWVSGTSSVQVEDFELFDSIGKIASVSFMATSSRLFVVDLPSAKLNNSGDIVLLKNAKGELLDQLIYGDVEAVSNTIGVIKKGESAIRILHQQSNSSTPFFITSQITKNSENIYQEVDSILPDIPAPILGGENSSPSNIPVYIPKFSVLINELVSDLTDESEEFIELFNTTNKHISLKNWWIEDGGKAKTLLDGVLVAYGFFVIEKPKGSLNNSGDQVTVFDQQGNIIDQVTYGNWDDGDLSDNAPVAKDPFSLSRRAGGKNSGQNSLDFFVTSQITKNSENIVEVFKENISEGEQDYLELIGVLQLSELFPNPKGSDSENEFIEIFNAGDRAIQLKGYKLGDASKKRFTFTEEVIQSKEYLIVSRKDSGIALNNSGEETVQLYAPNNMHIDQVRYSGKVQEEQSYIFLNGEWNWTDAPTPGKENKLSGEAAAPIISLFASAEGLVGEELTFDASDSVDPAELELNFYGDFGDEQTANGDSVVHRYTDPGVYELSLHVKNSAGASSTKQLFITIHQHAMILDQQSASIESLQKQIQISEILPNPKGSDYTEFIELFNPSLVFVDISGMQLDDQEGGSRIFTFPVGSVIAPQEYLVLTRKETGLVLNNTGDSVRLFSPQKELLREVVYEGSIEGASYMLDELGNFIWSLTPSPGGINIINEADIEVQPKKTASSNKKDRPIISTTILGAKEQDIGDRVEVYGIVTVVPDVFGSQYFYISHKGEGVQVYMYSKDFPELYEGKGIYVIGELSESSGERRIKIKEKTDIRAHDEPGAVMPTSTEIFTLSAQDYGGLVQLTGEVTEVKSSHAYIDDGTEEVKVYFKRGAGIEKKF